MRSPIALVDDDLHVLSSVASLLRSFGFEVSTYPSADAFLASSQRDFACLITDVQMPGTDGLALRRIVATWDKPLPVIIMTAYPERARATAIEGGPCDVIEKPVDSCRLVSRLAAIFGPLDGSSP